MLDYASQGPSTTKPSTPNFFRWFSASFCKQASAPNPTKLGSFQMTKGGKVDLEHIFATILYVFCDCFLPQIKVFIGFTFFPRRKAQEG